MSRALYHLSYGTAEATRRPGAQLRRAHSRAPLTEKILSCGLRPRLQLALLRPPLRESHSLPLVQSVSKKCRGAGHAQLRMVGSNWLRRSDSNRRPSGYEPDELPLLHSAPELYRRAGGSPDQLSASVASLRGTLTGTGWETG